MQNTFEFQIQQFKCVAVFNELQHKSDEDLTIINIPERKMAILFRLCKDFRDNPDETRMKIGNHCYKSKENPDGTLKDVEIVRTPHNQIQIGCLEMSNEEFKKFIILINHKKNEYVKYTRQEQQTDGESSFYH